jgi:membrane-bound lytic murein transglycosylase A
MCEATLVMRVLLFLMCLSLGCARKQIIEVVDALRPTITPVLSDDLPLENFEKALSIQLAHLKKHSGPEYFIFGNKKILRQDYLKNLEKLQVMIKNNPQDFFKFIENNYDFYQVYGRDRYGEVHLTSYYHSQLLGSKKRSSKYTQAIYALPDNLTLTRENIDSQHALTNKKLELCWLDPIDAFMLHVQGSGEVTFQDGNILQLNYAGKNNSPYVSIGKIIRTKYPDIKIDAHSLEEILRAMSETERQKIFNQNPSYIFFQESKELAKTHLGVPATEGRTIATDGDFFPKGAIAFLQFDAPEFKSETDLIPSRYHATSRFVLDQDIGGAIKGPGRVDLYWGSGASAKQHAGVISEKARLYYLVPKD